MARFRRSQASENPRHDATFGNYAFFVDPMILRIRSREVIAASMPFLVMAGSAGRYPLSAACAIAAVLVTDPTDRVIVSGIPREPAW